MPALSDDQRRILSRIASRLLNLRAGTPVTGLRKTLGPQRSLVDELLSGNLIRIVGGHYLPTFRGIENLEDDIRGIVRGNLDCVFKALQRLYRRSPDHQYTFSFESVVQEAKTIDPTRDANDVLPALLLGEEFGLHYFQDGIRGAQEGLAVENVTVHERILDFASVETSWKGMLAQDEAYRARVLARSEHALSYNARNGRADTLPATISSAQKTGSQESMHAAESETDDLLPVFRKRQFESDLARLLAQSNKNTPLSLLFLDLDHFKQVNDQYGHPVGDEVLVGVASALKTVCEGKGQCYRWGGEELVVLLPNYSSAEGVSLGERIRHTVSNLKFQNYPQMMTISVGVACHPETSSGDALVEHADRALYQAKQKGRNRVCIAPPVVDTGARRTRKPPDTSSSLPDVPISAQRSTLTEKPKRGRRTIPDNFLLGARNAWAGLLEECWPEIGWSLLCIRQRRDSTIEDVRKAFDPVKTCPHNPGLAAAFHHETLETAKATDIRRNRVELGELQAQVHHTQAKYDEVERSCHEAENALKVAGPDDESAIREEAIRRRQSLHQLAGDLRKLRGDAEALDKKLREQEAYVYRSELLDFLHGGKYAVNPRNLSNALAGLPWMGWHQSFRRCSGMPFNAAMLHYRVFEAVSQICSRLPQDTKPPVDFFRAELLKRSRTSDYSYQFLRENWRDLQLAIEECWQTERALSSAPFVLTSIFMRNAMRQKNAAELVLTQRAKLE